MQRRFTSLVQMVTVNSFKGFNCRVRQVVELLESAKLLLTVLKAESPMPTTRFRERLLPVGRVNILESKVQAMKNVKLEACEEKVLKSYLDGISLIKIPASRKKRLVVLRWLVRKFELEVTYTERQILVARSTGLVVSGASNPTQPPLLCLPTAPGGWGISEVLMKQTEL
ncbi:DUF2087 domain-containing protein [Scytonema sp. PCC 10023]|uniref:DUF2087 domain-containing protein n=1 Tax=Scytonema sp. PCC 10023 TaxID=1680591 RepID=UPI0039C5FC32